MRREHIIRVAAQSLLCCLLAGCSVIGRKANLTECAVPDSQTNRSEVVRLVAWVAGGVGMRDDTESQRVRLISQPIAGGYTLLAAYSETNRVPPDRITLWATADNGSVTASLHQAKRRRARTECYLGIEEHLTNVFRQSFGQGVHIRSRDYVVP